MVCGRLSWIIRIRVGGVEGELRGTIKISSPKIISTYLMDIQ
jgi:hypothetical protein